MRPGICIMHGEGGGVPPGQSVDPRYATDFNL